MEVKPDRKTFIDAIKGWSILGVILVHSDLWGGHSSTLAYFGATACQMFFVVGAYLLYESYARLALTFGRNLSIRHKVYWILKRFIRFIPLFYLAVILNLVFNQSSSYWYGAQGKVTFLNALSHFFFLHGLFPYYMDSVLGIEWYIGDLAILVVLIPLIYRLTGKLSQALGCWVGSILLAKGLSVLVLKINPLPVEDAPIWSAYATNYGIWNQLPVMLLGVILYRRLSDLIFNDHDAVNKKGLSIALLAISLIMISGLAEGWTKAWPFNYYTLCGIAFSLVFLSQYIYSIRLLDNPVMRLFGKYSYGIYLFHVRGLAIYGRVVKSITGSPVADAILRIIIISAVSLGFSVLVTRFVEKPLVGIMTNGLDKMKNKIETDR